MESEQWEDDQEPTIYLTFYDVNNPDKPAVEIKRAEPGQEIQAELRCEDSDGTISQCSVYQGASGDPYLDCLNLHEISSLFYLNTLQPFLF